MDYNKWNNHYKLGGFIMIRFLKRIYRYNDILSKDTKDKILKHKRRIEYFLIFIPLMFIITGYYLNSIIQKDYTNFKLIYRFSQDFIYKVNFNIFPISLIFIALTVLIITMYKPNLVYLFWSSLTFLSLLYLLIPGTENYAIEIMYQANIIINEYEFLTSISLLSVFLSLIIYKGTRKRLAMLIKNGIELFLLISIIYLEIIGDYNFFFFLKSFIHLFITSINLFNGTWEIFVTLFVSLIFLSLYSKKALSIMFFIKNKISLEKEMKRIKGYGEVSNMEIVQISDKIEMPLLKHEHLPNVGVIVPAFNESTTICGTINSLLKVDYNVKSFLTLVVSDGSTDNTVEMLKHKYNMHEIFIDKKPNLIEHKKARAIYVSSVYKNLILIDKPNGGKADALNTGLEHLPEDIKYVSVIDADSIVDKYSFRILATTAEKDSKIAALTGTILPRQNKKGSGFKSSLLTNIQMFDYLNSFHGERGASSLINSILIIPGAFGFFKKNTLLELRGYPKDVLAEDGILTVKIHRKKGVKIKFVPEAISYTQVPSTFTDLRKQRIRWFKGLTELMTLLKNTWKKNLKLTFVFLDYLFIEWVTPIMAPIGLCVVIANPKMITYPIFYLFMLLAVVTPIIQGILCLAIESSYRKVKLSRLIYLPLTVIISPFMILWRNDALLDLKNRNWGVIKRH